MYVCMYVCIEVVGSTIIAVLSYLWT